MSKVLHRHKDFKVRQCEVNTQHWTVDYSDFCFWVTISKDDLSVIDDQMLRMRISSQRGKHLRDCIGYRYEACWEALQDMFKERSKHCQRMIEDE